MSRLLTDDLVPECIKPREQGSRSTICAEVTNELCHGLHCVEREMIDRVIRTFTGQTKVTTAEETLDSASVFAEH